MATHVMLVTYHTELAKTQVATTSVGQRMVHTSELDQGCEKIRDHARQKLQESRAHRGSKKLRGRARASP